MAATEQVLVKFEPEALAAVDRVRGDVPRTVWIKRLCSAAVLAHDGLAGVELPVVDAKVVEAAVLDAIGVGSSRRSRAEVAAVTGHHEGCGCLKCYEAEAR